jgi:hypothetical protein
MEQGVNQLIKWGTAGWCLVVQVSAFLITLKLVLSTSGAPFPILLGRMPQHPSPEALLAILATASIPLGFLVYEIYYFLFWAIPLSKEKPAEQKLVRRLLVKCSEYEMMDKDLAAVQRAWIRKITRNRKGHRRWWVKGLEKWRGRKPEDVMKFRNEWSLVRAVWLRAISRGGSGSTGYSRAADRFEFLSSMFDGLGVMQTALWLGVGFLAIFSLWRWLLEPLAFYPFMGAIQVPLVVVFVVGLLIAAATTWLASWILGVNRILTRSSMLTLANSVICHFECEVAPLGACGISLQPVSAGLEVPGGVQAQGESADDSVSPAE